MSTKKPQSHKKKQLDPQMRRALESAKKALARRAARQRELTIRRSVYIVLAAVLVLLTGFFVFIFIGFNIVILIFYRMYFVIK